MKKEVNIQTDEKNKVEVTVLENKDYQNSSYVRVRLKVNTDEKIKMTDAVNMKNEIYDDFTENTIYLKDLPEFIEKVQVTVYTNSANNVEYDGDMINV